MPLFLDKQYNINDAYQSPGSILLNYYKKMNFPDNEPLWMNLGLWNSGDNYAQACAHLTDWIIDQALFKHNAKILDVGSGFCEPAIYIAQKYPKVHITSINIEAEQIALAQKRIHSFSLQQQIQTFHCPAENLIFADETFDVVFALESAFHFHNRTDFLHEAYRVLKKGGRLVIADMITKSNTQFTIQELSFIKNYGIPLDNLIDASNYKCLLQKNKFVIEKFISVPERVYVFAQRLAQKISQGEPLASCSINAAECPPIAQAWDQLGLNDFILTACTKS